MPAAGAGVRARAVWRAAGVLVIAIGGAWPASRAAGQARTDSVRTASGQVTVMRGTARVPIPGAWVTLHRVGTDDAGPLDSVRTDRRGSFALRYRTRPGKADAYFVSAMHDGLAYFSAALDTGAVRDGSADLTVFDTTSHGVPVSIASRHLVVAAPDASGARAVAEMYVLANGGARTLVSGAAGTPTFLATLPAGATDPRAGDGDVHADAMHFAGAQVMVDAPIAPGTQRLTVDYTMPRGTGTFALGRSGAIGLLDVLVEDSAGTAVGAGLEERPSGVYGGRTFRHFVATDVAPGSMVTVSVPVVTGGPRVDTVTVIVIAVAVALVMALGLALRRDGPSFDDVALAEGGRSG